MSPIFYTYLSIALLIFSCGKEESVVDSSCTTIGQKCSYGTFAAVVENKNVIAAYVPQSDYLLSGVGPSANVALDLCKSKGLRLPLQKEVNAIKDTGVKIGDYDLCQFIIWDGVSSQVNSGSVYGISGSVRACAPIDSVLCVTL